MFGAVEVLVPLQIADLGGGHALIAGGFIAGAALEAAAGPACRSLLGPGRDADPLRVRPQHLRGGDGRDRRRGDHGRGDGGADPHFAGRRHLLHAGADHALGGGRVEPASPGLRRRPLQHGLGARVRSSGGLAGGVLRGCGWQRRPGARRSPPSSSARPPTPYTPSGLSRPAPLRVDRARLRGAWLRRAVQQGEVWA